MKTYKETKQAMKELVLTICIDNIVGFHFNEMRENGHTTHNIINAHHYFLYSPQAAKYRK